LLAQASDRSLAARDCEFRDVDEGFARNSVGMAWASPVWTLTIVAMVAFCQCFARPVNSEFAVSEKSISRVSPCSRRRRLLCMGLFSHFLSGSWSDLPRGGMPARKRDCEFRRDR
jgi:hypothetical protein